jgi:hypothetical protein
VTAAAAEDGDDSDDTEEWRDHIAPRSLSGYLTKNDEQRTVQLLKCPACGRDFTDRWREHHQPLDRHLLNDHSPEDFGLTREEI